MTELVPLFPRQAVPPLHVDLAGDGVFEGYLVPGDVMLAQKIAMETDELGALAVAHRVAPVVRRVGPAQSWT
ncbi:hypothetical protein [Bradyrhizobium sp. UNPA324]|uniref:hypothetical protein n=1 Tax=Bradyrhizobium sp. UNPA324 TaxID=1141174 RepID=UPI0015EE9F31|nr:hypothetical protein [Bradyrhizobium sp. UNPA324]